MHLYLRIFWSNKLFHYYRVWSLCPKHKPLFTHSESSLFGVINSINLIPFNFSAFFFLMRKAFQFSALTCMHSFENFKSLELCQKKKLKNKWWASQNELWVVAKKYPVVLSFFFFSFFFLINFSRHITKDSLNCYFPVDGMLFSLNIYSVFVLKTSIK